MKNESIHRTLRSVLISLISVALLIALPGASVARGPYSVSAEDSGTGHETVSVHQYALGARDWTAATPRTDILLWQLIGPAGGESVLDIDVDPRNSQRLYTATQNGIYRSVDGGLEWDTVLSGFFRELVIDPQNSSTIYAGQRGPSGYGVYKSTDGGDTWHHYNQGMTCDNLATMSIAATNPSILFIGSY